MSQRIPSHQQNQKGIPICQVCKLECVPESSQSIYFLLLEFLLVFLSVKIAIITFFIGYSFCQTCWKCPVCTRQQEINENEEAVSQQVAEANKNVILRMGKCMTIISINKFRIFSFIVCSCILYWFLSQFKAEKPKVHMKKSWENIARDCGYQALLQNSYRANQNLDKYVDDNQLWTLEGVYLQTIKQFKSLSYMKVKMDPTQFSDRNTQDIVIVTETSKILQKLQKTDIVTFTGHFQGRQLQAFKFIASNFSKMNKKKILQQIKPLIKSSLRKNQ